MFYSDLSDYMVEVKEVDLVGKGLRADDMIDLLGQLKTNSGLDRIKQSIEQIISTKIGTRFFNPSFGSRVYSALGEPNDFILGDLVAFYIREALEKWESRIEVLDVITSTEDPTIVNVKIDYKVKATSEKSYVVYVVNRS